MHHDRAGEVVETGTEGRFEPALDTEVAVPGDALEEGIDQADQQEGGDQLRVEARALGDAAGDDRRDRGGERQQEEELDQLVAVVLDQRRRGVEEARAVGHHVADEEVADGRRGEVADDLDQRVDLVLGAHGADLEEREAGVHGQHHDGAEQHEEDVDTRL
jgi:hypothetical protein